MTRSTLVLVGALYRLGMGLACATPVAAVVARHVGEHPRSDAVLWETGGYWLVEAARLAQGHLAAPLAAGGVIAMVLSFGWLLLTGALIAHAHDRQLDAIDLTVTAFERFAPLTVLHGLTLVGQVLALIGAGALGRHFATPDKSGDLLRLGLFGGALLAVALMAVGHDAARVICVRDRPNVWTLINRTFERLRVEPLRLFLAASWRGAAAWLCFALALWLGAQLLPGSPAQVAAAVVVQLGAVSAYVGLRLSWFARLLQDPSSQPELTERSPQVVS